MSNNSIAKFLLICAFLSMAFLSIMMVPSNAGEYRLTTDTAAQITPAIYGEKVVYADFRHDADKGDIYLYNLGAGRESRLTDSAADQREPAIDGNKVVWQDERNGNRDIYQHNLTGGAQTRITSDNSTQQAPAISGDRIVWQDYRHGNWDIYLYDPASGEARITTDSAEQSAPAISGDNVVWQDRRHGNLDIYLYNITTGSTSRLTADAADQSAPDIDGDKVVWQDSRAGNPDIFLRNLTLGVESQVTTDPKSQRAPAVQGDKIVYEDNRVRYWDIRMFNLTNGKDYRLSEARSSERHPDVYGDQIVWHAKRHRDNDVFLFELETPATKFSTDLGAPNGMKGWYMTRPTVKLIPDEPATVYYQWDSTGAAGWKLYAGQVAALEGKHTIHFYGDCGGKVEGVKSKKLKVDTVGPLATLTTPAAALGGGRFKVRWQGSDPTPLSVLTGFEVEYKVGAEGVWAPWLSATARTFASRFAGSLGETYYLRARAKDRAGNLGVWSAVSKTLVPHDQDSNILKRRGFDELTVYRAGRAGRGFFKRTVRFSKRRGDRVVYKFTGDSFTLLTTKGPKRGKVKIYVDGVYRGTVDAYAGAVSYRQAVFTTNWPEVGKHTVRIVNEGTPGRRRFDLDAYTVGR